VLMEITQLATAALTEQVVAVGVAHLLDAVDAFAQDLRVGPVGIDQVACGDTVLDAAAANAAGVVAEAQAGRWRCRRDQAIGVIVAVDAAALRRLLGNGVAVGVVLVTDLTATAFTQQAVVGVVLVGGDDVIHLLAQAVADLIEGP